MLDFSFTVRKTRGRFDSAAIHSNSEYRIPATLGEFKPSASSPRLLIVGASTRASAWSAVRAGLSPVCADLFADEDLRQVADVVSVACYPDSLIDDLKHSSADAWLFTGAMENHLPLLERLIQSTQFGHYCGPPLAATAKLRNPAWLADRLRPLGCYPEIAALPGESPVSDWLRKPLASGGGRDIQRFQPNGLSVSSADFHYRQRFITGTPMAAVFLVTGEGSLGLMVSEQIIGSAEAFAPTEFAYCGSIGPLPMSAGQTSQLDRIAETLIEGLNYRGLLGLDLVWDGRQFWLVEVNPRYTASCELWDLWSGRSAVGEHLRACGMTNRKDGGHRRLDPPYENYEGGRILGKLILYADRELIAPDLSCCLASRPTWSVPWIADVPAAGLLIPAQSPVCTVFASAGTKNHCLEKLRRRAQRVRRWFTKNTSPRRQF